MKGLNIAEIKNLRDTLTSYQEVRDSEITARNDAHEKLLDFNSPSKLMGVFGPQYLNTLKNDVERFNINIKLYETAIDRLSNKILEVTMGDEAVWQKSYSNVMNWLTELKESNTDTVNVTAILKTLQYNDPNKKE